MLGLGLFLIVVGLCAFGMAALLKLDDGTSKKGKKKKKRKKDELAQAPPPNPMGFYLGGTVFLLAGIGFVVAALLD